MPKEGKSGREARLAEQYAKEALLKERKARVYSDESKKFLIDVDSLSGVDRRQLSVAFSRAAEKYGDAAKNDEDYEIREQKKYADMASRFYDIAGTYSMYGNPFKREISRMNMIKHKVERTGEGGLEKGVSKHVFAFFSILSLFSSLALISFNLTGGVIGAQDNNNPVSIALFILGLAFALFYFRQKDRRK